jgi:hypothetical protein
MIPGPVGSHYLTCDLRRLDVRGDLDQEPGSGYGDYWHGVLLRVVYEYHFVLGYRLAMNPR